MEKNSKRVCIIGLDGVGLHNIKTFLNTLTLNTIQTIINKGFASSFISIPPYTPNAWTSIFTGVNPGKHNIYGFYKVNRNHGFTFSLTTSYDVKYPRIFEIFSMFNLRSIIINVPMTYPVQGLIGLKNLVAVSDWASPKQFIYPRHYERKYKEYLIEPPHNWSQATNKKSYVKTVENYLEKRLDLYNELLENENYDLFIIVFSELDWLMHRIPEIVEGKQLNLINKILFLVDKFIHKATETCDLTILVSDHGFDVSRVFIGVNSILANNGLISFRYKFNIGKQRFPQKITMTKHDNTKNRTNSITNIVLRSFITFIKKTIPQNIWFKIRPLIPAYTEIDYYNSKAFMLEPPKWGVYVKKGYIEIVKNIFNNIRLIDKVLHNNEVFWGPYTKEAPDLILIPKKHVFFDTRINIEPIHRDYMSHHEQHALIAFHGDDVLPYNNIDDKVKVTIYDIVPTVLAYVGLPLPSNSDGQPLTKIFNTKLSSTKRKINYLQRFKILRRIKGINIH